MHSSAIRDTRYTIKLDQFEGPFDLLIELARSRELELSEISLAEITDDFLHFMETEDISHEMKGDFLIVAATLLLLKIKAALPRLSEAEEEETQDLAARLRVYQLYREQAEWLREAWQTRRLFDQSAFGPEVFTAPVAAIARLPMSVDGLAVAAREALGRLKKYVRPTAHLQVRGRSLRECLHLFEERLNRAQKFVFQHAVRNRPKGEAAISLLAVLEMARQNQARLEQSDSFGELTIHRAHG